MRTIGVIGTIIVLVFVGVYFADHPGHVTVVWQGRQFDTTVGVLVPAVILLGMLAAAFWHLLRKIVTAPAAFVRARRERRRRQGYRALTQGMVAVAAGDAEEAQRLARDADVLLNEPPLTLLLSAQAAQLNGDEQAARRYFSAMLERPETEFLGLRGLIMQARRGGDEAMALRLTRRARDLRPRTPWVLASLFELEARGGRWSDARAALTDATKQKAIAAPESRRHRAVLLFEESRAAQTAGNAQEALKLAAAAHSLEPAFAPAAVHYAKLLRAENNLRQARKAVETAWRLAPHPALGALYGELFAEEPPLARIKRIEHLAALNPGHIESGLAQAEAALAARLWGEARRHLQAAMTAADASKNETAPAPRLCRMMAEIEEAERNDLAAARFWLARAAASATPDPTYVCRECSAESAQWTPLCPRCRAFDTLEWRRPDRATPLLPDLAPLRPVNLPVPMAPPLTPGALAIDAPRRHL